MNGVSAPDRAAIRNPSGISGNGGIAEIGIP